MGEEESQSQSERRSFLTGLNAGVSTVVATVAMAAATASTASGQTATSAPWQPGRHELDDWLDKDKASVKHRFIFDTINPEGFGQAILYSGTTLDSVLKRGVQLAVCQMTTRNFAGTIARAVGGSTDTIYNEITANLVTNSHLVPPGIVAVNRAQERGYSFVHA